MKKILLSFILTTIALIMPSMVSAADSGWYLYIWSETSNSGSDLGQFQTTATDGLFVLKGITTTETGLKYCIRNSDWSACYGWSEGTDGSVSATGTDVVLGSTSTASGWLGLPAGNYDVTFNLTNLTIRFDEHQGKKVSILGDSYSTMQGSLTPETNAYWYTLGANAYHTTDVTTVEQTWWYQFINSGDYVLERNNSYSGSTMVNTPLENMDVSTTFINRANNLGSPDIIFIFGGTNDNWNTALTMGDYKYSEWTDEDKKQFRPGFAYLLNFVKTNYPSAEIYFILNDILSAEVNNSVTTICDYYNVPCIVTKGVGKSDYHPNAAGMTTIANQVKAVVESANDEGNTWFISGDFNSWATSQTFTQSATNSDVFVLDNFKIASTKLDEYKGFTFQITSSGWAKAYTYNATISTTGVYALDDKTSDGAWESAYCTAMSAGTRYMLTWNKRTHVLKIEESPSPDPAISYTTYPDGHAVATIDDYLRGGDISMLNYVEDMGAKFYDADGTEKDPLDIMQENGVNIVRLRLYNNPGESVTYYTGSAGTTANTYKLPAGYLDEADVLKLARRAKAHNMKIELTFHYSDFWTNGEMQIKPKGWENYTFDELKQAVHDYTYNFLQKMNAQGTTPEYVSLGNEIQGGLLFGYYNGEGSDNSTKEAQLNTVNAYAKTGNMDKVAALLAQGSSAVRSACPDSKVVIHLTLSESITTSTYQWFFDAMRDNSLDYDIIGASYYPYWTNQKPTMLNELANTMYSRYSKDLLIMEVGYSWTQYRPSGRYNGNYVGQLEMNGTAYNEASEAGLKSFMQEVQTVVKGNDHILGYLYWDPVMVEQQMNSSWIKTCWAHRKSGDTWYEDGNQVGNTTWFDYEGKALDVFEVIKDDAHIVPSTVTIEDTEYTVEQQVPYELSMSSVGYSTFYDADARAIPDGLKAYTAERKSSTELTLNEITGGSIPAATGVLLEGDAGTYYLWPRYDVGTTISGNLLKGTQQEQTIEAETGSNYYYKLANNAEHGLGWYWGAANGGVFTNGAHKAYLVIPQNAGTRGFIDLFGQTTSIEEGLKVEDGESLVGPAYNLSGQRVATTYKGVVVKGGRKMIMK